MDGENSARQLFVEVGSGSDEDDLVMGIQGVGEFCEGVDAFAGIPVVGDAQEYCFLL